MASSSQTAYVHVGLGKTGTSTIQRALTEQQEALAELGIHVPGRSHADTRRAVYDLMGRRIGGADRFDDSKVTGAWKPFAASIRASPAPTVVFSEEMLALARPRVVKRLVDSLAPRRVVVIVTLRDLGRVLGSYWQQTVMMGRTEGIDDFLRAVRDPDSGPASAGVGFWLRQDVIRTLNAWETVVARDDIRVVTLPGPGQPPDLLNDRFADAIGAPAGLLRGSKTRGNVSLGLAETEVVRRLNEQLTGSIQENQRLSLMRVIRGGLVDRESAQIAVPAAEFAWIEKRAAKTVIELETRGYPVFGSLDDLRPKPAPGFVPAFTDRQVADAALAALAAVSRDRSRLWARWRRRRRQRAQQQGAERPGAERPGANVASRARAASFRTRMRALEKADRSKVLGWAARRYLTWSSRR